MVDNGDELGTPASRAIHLMNELRSSGIQHDLDIPRIAFAGKQSAGKSSLVEALTGVQLPKDHGTCTRCPIEVTTTRRPKADWRCHLKLRFEYNDATMTQNEKPNVEPFCELTAEESETMAAKIKDAQEAILQHANGRKFSRNVVCVEIISPHCQDLSLIDLPGLIEASDTPEDEIYIDLILSLVRDYLSKENTIILQIMQADEDVENQKIRTLAREVDPDGNRSIGVLTKPDKIEADTEGSVIDILLARKYELRYGYFVVRTPKQAEINSFDVARTLMKSNGSPKKGKNGKNTVDVPQSPMNTFSMARQIEQRYFASDPVGVLLSRQASSRCGSNKLVLELSKMLRSMINQQVPLMKVKLLELIAQTDIEQLKAGKSIEKGTARESLLRQSQDLERLVKSHVNAAGVDKDIWHQIDAELHNSANKIQQASPLFAINGRLLSHRLLLKSDGKETPTVTLELNQKQQRGNETVMSKVYAVGEAEWVLVYEPAIKISNDVHVGHGKVKLMCVALPSGASGVKATFTLSAEDAHHKCRKVRSFSLNDYSEGSEVVCPGVAHITLEGNISIDSYIPNMSCPDILNADDVEAMILAATGRVLPLPGRPEYDASVQIISEAVSKWKDPSIACVENMHRILSRLGVEGPNCLVEQATASRFKKLRNSCLEIWAALLDEKAQLTKECVMELWKGELHPFTTNRQTLLSLRQQLIGAIREEIKPDMSEKIASTLAALSEEVLLQLANAGITKDRLSILQTGQACSDRVIETIANVMAYFHLKADGYADNVAGTILLHLLEYFTTDFGNEMSARIGVFTKTEDELYDLFCEGDDLLKLREELQRKSERQRDALILINNHLNEY